jgi:hypothetical protein
VSESVMVSSSEIASESSVLNVQLDGCAGCTFDAITGAFDETTTGVFEARVGAVGASEGATDATPGSSGKSVGVSDDTDGANDETGVAEGLGLTTPATVLSRRGLSSWAVAESNLSTAKKTANDTAITFMALVTLRCSERVYSEYLYCLLELAASLQSCAFDVGGGRLVGYR